MAGSTEGGAISHGELCSSLKNLTESCAAIRTCVGLMTPLLSTFSLLELEYLSSGFGTPISPLHFGSL